MKQGTDMIKKIILAIALLGVALCIEASEKPSSFNQQLTNIQHYIGNVTGSLKGINVEVSKELTLQEYKKRSLYIRFKESISRLLSPIL